VNAAARSHRTPTSDWTTSEIPDLDGKTVIVTGANSGIGLETARAFAEHGAHVVLAVRDAQKGREAADRFDGSTEIRPLDLADLASIRRFADEWSGDIHILVNNAGVMIPPLGRTVDGFELQFGVNHLGHFALTNLLLPHITGRVVTVASGAHRSGTIDFDDLNWEHRRYGGGSGGYGQSKLANLLFTVELQRRLTASGSQVLAMAAHPGMAATNLGSHSGNPVMTVIGNIVVQMFAQDAAGGATPTLFVATADLDGNSYAGPGGRRELTGAPTLVGRSDAALDLATARRLWTESEELTHVTYPAAELEGV